MPDDRIPADYNPMALARVLRVRRGVTLIELLIVLALLGVLLGILLPVLNGAIDASRSFRCQMSMRNVALDLTMFIDLDEPRPQDPCGRHGHVALETFQESLYGIDEYWRYGSDRSQVSLGNEDDVPLRCAAVRGDLVLRRDAPCSSGGVASWNTVSYGFNARLHRVDGPGGRSMGTCLTERVLENGMVPLAWDVDGKEATRRGVTPVFSAPPIGDGGLYDDGLSWMPAARHGSGMNVVFMDGHIDSSHRPLEEAGWRWDYYARH
ncbi:MAG: prepilin-type N-terminal cleavage/methylation domain-containing protein [Phycisphaera sp.]|nr:MAG: prepilin-type N-terminal cleavage/methylation domain-containing protein [Phycisphaera sp.]